MSTATMKGRVLIAEDEASLRNLIEMGLAANQYEVIATANGRETLDVFMAEQDNIDVVVLDILMPELEALLWPYIPLSSRYVFRRLTCTGKCSKSRKKSSTATTKQQE